jgi:hypothetical protein
MRHCATHSALLQFSDLRAIAASNYLGIGGIGMLLGSETLGSSGWKRL